MMHRTREDGTCTWMMKQIGANQSLCVLIALVLFMLACGTLYQEEVGAEEMVHQMKEKLGLSNQQFLDLQKEHKTNQQQYAALLKEFDSAKAECDTQLSAVNKENEALKAQVQGEGGQIKALKDTIKAELAVLSKHVE